MKRLFGGLVAAIMSFGIVAVTPATESQAAYTVPSKCPKMSGYKLWQSREWRQWARPGLKTPSPTQRTCVWRKGTLAKGYTYKMRVYERDMKALTLEEYHMGKSPVAPYIRMSIIRLAPAHVYNFGPYKLKKAKSKSDHTAVWLNRPIGDYSNPDAWLNFFQQMPATGKRR